MEFHKALKPFIHNISKLQFSTKHDMTPSSLPEYEGYLDVLTRTSCNGMYLEEFKQLLETTVNEILQESKELRSTLGTYYQREILDIVLHADRIQHHYFNNRYYQGIEETVDGFDLFGNELFQLGVLDYDKIVTRTEPKVEFYLVVLYQIEQLKTELSELIFDEKQEVKPIEKLEWNVSADKLGALILELQDKDWIRIPPSKKGGEPSLRELATVCSNIFAFQGKKGPTSGTKRSLENVVTGEQGLDVYRAERIKLVRPSEV